MIRLALVATALFIASVPLHEAIHCAHFWLAGSDYDCLATFHHPSRWSIWAPMATAQAGVHVNIIWAEVVAYSLQAAFILGILAAVKRR